MNQLLNGDCLEVMLGIPDQSIGMVFADLPYGVTACHWDKVIDLEAMWVQLKRIIQPKRACVFTATQPFTTDLICSNREWFKYCCVWAKSQVSGFLSADKQPLRSHEDVVLFGNGRLLYNPQKSKGAAYSISRVHATANYGAQRSNSTHNDGERYPQSILKFPLQRFAGGHPTQKPVALVEYLIRTYTNPGDVVLDPTAGSMTTAIACLNTGRGYICIEKDPDEYRKGLARVEEHLAKPVQFNLLEPPPTLPEKATAEQASIFDLCGGVA